MYILYSTSKQNSSRQLQIYFPYIANHKTSYFFKKELFSFFLFFLFWRSFSRRLYLTLMYTNIHTQTLTCTGSLSLSLSILNTWIYSISPDSPPNALYHLLFFSVPVSLQPTLTQPLPLWDLTSHRIFFRNKKQPRG